MQKPFALTFRKSPLEFVDRPVQINEIIVDTESAITKILNKLKKHNKRLLITIDEMTNTPSMRIFTSAFQIFVRQELPIFLLGASLYENIDELQNEKTLTFLYRAPKIPLQPLNKQVITKKYKAIHFLIYP